MASLIGAGVLLAATAIDANGSLFPLAHAVVDAENDDNWRWFLHLLLTVVQSYTLQSLIDKALVFLSDHQKGLLEGVDLVFANCPYGYCLKHLEANLIKEFKNSKLKEFLWKAAYIMTQTNFDKALEDMANINVKSVPWLLSHTKPEHWAEFYFPGRRYGHLTSNIVESLNSWILDAREWPILAMFECIRYQLMKWFDEHCTLEDKTTGLLVTKAVEHLQLVTNTRAHRYQSVPSVPGIVFEVLSCKTNCNYIVNLEERICTCLVWQTSGHPCGHAIAILLQLKLDLQHYVKSFFTLEGYKKTYEQPLFPLDLKNVTGDVVHAPPCVPFTVSHSSLDSDSDSGDSDATDFRPPSSHHPSDHRIPWPVCQVSAAPSFPPPSLPSPNSRNRGIAYKPEFRINLDEAGGPEGDNHLHLRSNSQAQNRWLGSTKPGCHCWPVEGLVVVALQDGVLCPQVHISLPNSMIHNMPMHHKNGLEGAPRYVNGRRKTRAYSILADRQGSDINTEFIFHPPSHRDLGARIAVLLFQFIEDQDLTKYAAVLQSSEEVEALKMAVNSLLQKIHSCGIFHYDITAGNLL
jgi:hypothetical protein